jgi:hypothetical protein
MASTIHTLVFEALPPADAPAPSVADIRSELMAHPGMWAVVYRADRMARAEKFAEAVNGGAKYGAGVRAEVRKLGAECRVFAGYMVPGWRATS